MEQNENEFLKREKKSQPFDKRLIKAIVKAVEEGLPRKQAIALHGMSLGALQLLHLYGQKVKSKDLTLCTCQQTESSMTESSRSWL